MIHSRPDCLTLSQGVIYLPSCLKCSVQYIGQTNRPFKERAREHLNKIDNQKGTIGSHFNSTGHVRDHIRFQIIERVIPNSTHPLLERESVWMKRFATKIPFGLNKKD